MTKEGKQAHYLSLIIMIYFKLSAQERKTSVKPLFPGISYYMSAGFDPQKYGFTVSDRETPC